MINRCLDLDMELVGCLYLPIVELICPSSQCIALLLETSTSTFALAISPARMGFSPGRQPNIKGRHLALALTNVHKVYLDGSRSCQHNFYAWLYLPLWWWTWLTCCFASGYQPLCPW